MKKHISTLVLALTLCLTLIPLTAQAADSTTETVTVSALLWDWNTESFSGFETDLSFSVTNVNKQAVEVSCFYEDPIATVYCNAPTTLTMNNGFPDAIVIKKADEHSIADISVVDAEGSTGDWIWNTVIDETYGERCLGDGTNVTITQAGVYLVQQWYLAANQTHYVFCLVVEDGGAEITPPPAPTTAKPTASTVLVNGKNVAFDAYNINGNNYFKLRDLAYTLSGTGKQFDVGWDGANNAISLTSGKAYTTVGGEMTGKGAGEKTPTATSSKIYLDGKEVSLTAYNISGNNYFKLRDIGQAFDFGVTWDGAKNTIVMDTSKGYTPE